MVFEIRQAHIQTLRVPEPLRIENPAFRQFARNLGFNPDKVPVSGMSSLRGEWDKSKEKKADDLWSRERGAELRLFQEMRTRGGWEELQAPKGFQIVEGED